MAVMLAAVSAMAATTPLEADFPEGYWDREVAVYSGRSATAYSVGLAVEDPAKARAQVESALKVPGAKLMNFSDQTSVVYQAGNEYSTMMRMRPAYTLSYQLPEGKSAAVAHKLIGMGRLISYNVQTPFANPQMKEISDRIDWIDKEMKRSAGELKTMPVSRAMLQSKLKHLQGTIDAIKATAGVASITVQIMREDPDAGTKPAVAAPMP
jgi:hypothetical protein